MLVELVELCEGHVLIDHRQHNVALLKIPTKMSFQLADLLGLEEGPDASADILLRC